jgi:hypothetical protein
MNGKIGELGQIQIFERMQQRDELILADGRQLDSLHGLLPENLQGSPEIREGQCSR